MSLLSLCNETHPECEIVIARKRMFSQACHWNGSMTKILMKLHFWEMGS